MGLFNALMNHSFRLFVKALRDAGKTARSTSPSARIRVNLASVWDIRCGIAYYSKFLAGELRKVVALKLVSLPDKGAFNPVKMLVLGFKAGRGCDVAHVQLEYGNFASLGLGRFRLPSFGAVPFYVGLSLGKCKKVTTLHEVSLGRGRFGRGYMMLLNRFLISLSDLVIVHTAASRDLLVKEHHIRTVKVKVLPHGSLQNPLFLEKEESKAKLRLTGKQIVTVLGFVNWTKGQDLVVEALPLMEAKPHLLIAGGARLSSDDDYCKRLVERVKTLALSERVSFLGFVEDSFLPTVMGATDVAVLPKRGFYGQSGILNILIAYKVPTVASDIESFREVKNRHDCIELFKQEDAEDLASKLDLLLRDDNKRNYLASKCVDAWRALNWSSIAAAHRREYLELLSFHPDLTYDEEKQRERIDWLKTRREGFTLEMGCATGFVTSYTGADIGIDLDARRIILAKANYPNREFIVADATRLPFADSVFDTVLIPEMLEHVPLNVARGIVNESKRVAGKLLVTVPNAEKKNYDVTLVENPEHLWRPTQKLILDMLGSGAVEYTREKDFILATYRH